MPESEGASFAASVRREASGWDQAGRLPREIIQTMAEAGFLAADLPIRYGGAARSPSALGELCTQLGGVCTALRSLVTVQGMVAAALLRWGTEEQRSHWLPALASGAQLAGFAATEPGAGTDLGAVNTSIRREGDGLVLRGHKQWITFGELADVVLVLARLEGEPATVLVETDRPGTVVEPVRGQLGMRAAQLAHICFDGVHVPADNLVAPAGFGLSHVAGTVLDHARFTVAWGCVGMATACLEYATAHAANRTQGGVRLADHQVVRAQLGRALVATTAARELCARATRSRQDETPDTLMDTMIAKYAAARAAVTVSQDAVQVHGAAGCGSDSPVGRFFRDAKIMQIIESAEQVAELHIGDHALRRFRPQRQAGTESGTESGTVRAEAPRAETPW
ncbi:MAG: acyl-CoA dehydrogenase family protein [Pseudonocardiaceae bacterium]